MGVGRYPSLHLCSGRYYHDVCANNIHRKGSVGWVDLLGFSIWTDHLLLPMPHNSNEFDKIQGIREQVKGMYLKCIESGLEKMDSSGFLKP